MNGTSRRTGGSPAATNGTGQPAASREPATTRGTAEPPAPRRAAKHRQRAARPHDSHYRRLIAAWERFAAGEDSVGGVRPEILMSWYRCREEYKVDPQLTQAPPAPGQGAHSLEHDSVFAELGGLAAVAARHLNMLDGLATVTDCDGRILASWGDREILGRAAESNLAPWATWSERACGTNGMGTALESHHPVVVRGPEHWCKGFHDWACAGMAIRDAVTGEPLAVLNVSRRRADIPQATADWLHEAAEAVQERLRKRARHTGTELVAAFTDAKSRNTAPVAAVDTAGKVVIANEEAALLLGVPAETPAADPAHRWTSQVPELANLAAQAAERARQDPQWVGSARIFVPFTSGLLPVTVHPIRRVDQVIGMLIGGGLAAGDPLPTAPANAAARAGQPRPLPGRVIGRRGTRLVLLGLHEIRFAESDGNTIWLTADQGRLQATIQGLDNLEQQLAGQGFLRVHRRFLVNLRRVREIEQGFKGGLFLLTDVRAHEIVPVSRRHAPGLRRALGV